MNINKIETDLDRIYTKIAELQKKAEDLETKKKECEDLEYIKIIRKHGISAENLQLLIDIEKEEQKRILKEREV